MGTVKYTGPVASFHCPTNAEIRSLKVHFSPKQEGSGDPNPENVRPIVGWDGVVVEQSGENQRSTTNYEFGVLGKNKFNKNDSEKIISGIQIHSSGKITGSSTSTTVFVPCQPNTTYTISKLATARAVISYAITDTMPQIDDSIYGYQNIANQSTATIATGDNAKWLCIYITNTTYDSTSVQDILDSLQVELGSTATAYEPYNPNHTVYGGWVDLISGEVAEEWACINIPFDKTWDYSSSSYYLQDTNLPTINCAITNFIISHHKNTEIAANTSIYISSSKYWVFGTTVAENLNLNSSEEINIWLKEQADNGTPVQICGTLTSSAQIHYFLAPIQLQTFLGQNNVWSNADYVEVEYDLHETQDILARKQFIMANQPHIVTPAAAPLQNFVTDVPAPLKECKVHFGPVQEGTGDPSPSNVRPIMGWTKCNVYHTEKNIVDFTLTSYTNDRGSFYNGYSGWCQELHNLSVLSGISVTYSVDIDATNTSGASDSNVRIWGKYKDNSWAFLASGGNNIAPGNSGKSIKTITIPNNLEWIVFGLGLETEVTASNPVVEIGSTTTPYSFYTGTTIPITFPSITNLLNSTTIITNKTLSSAGEKTSENGMSLTNYIKVNEGDTYKLTFTSKEGARTRRIYGYDANKDPVESLASVSWVTIDATGTVQATIPSGVEYIRVCYKTADENIFLEGPESSVIYGGYVDLMRGEVVQTHYLASVLKSQFGNQLTPSSNGIPYRQTISLFPDTASGTSWVTARQQQIFNYGKIANPWSETTYGSYVGVIITQNNVGTYMRISEDIYQALSDNDRVEISYELAAPITYQIDQTTLKALRGTNNIWASNNGGNIEVSFWRH